MKATPKITLTLLGVFMSVLAFGQQQIKNDLVVQDDDFQTVLDIKGGVKGNSSVHQALFKIHRFNFSTASGIPFNPGGLSIFYEDIDGSIMYIRPNGNIGIGTSVAATENFKLSVGGTIRAKEIVCETGWSDFVFAPEYRLRPLSEVESFIQENHHLPEIPSAEEVATNGVKMAEMESKLLQKVEELTLYAIEANKKIEEMAAKIAELESKIAH